MTENFTPKSFQRIMLFVAGAAVLLLGIMLTLAWWVYIKAIFKGTVGVALALLGMLMLYMAKE